MKVVFLKIFSCLSIILIASNQVHAVEATLEGRLVITGSSTVAPLVLEMGKSFEKKHAKVRVDVQTGGSSRGIADARQGMADIGMVSRAKHPSEKELKFFSIALDGIAIIVHKTNSVDKLTEQQLQDIFTAKISNWQELGHQDAAITVVNKAAGRSTLELFLQYFSLKASDIKAQIIIGDNEQGIKTVAGNPMAIGYVSIGAAEYSASQGVPIKLLPLKGVKASVANVQNGQYPLSRSLNLVTKLEKKTLTRAFIDFAQSEQVHDLVKGQFFVPIEH
ncbi:MAG: phosphate ABC transporter substrate-binding protein [Oligoflexus sp.]